MTNCLREQREVTLSEKSAYSWLPQRKTMNRAGQVSRSVQGQETRRHSSLRSVWRIRKKFNTRSTDLHVKRAQTEKAHGRLDCERTTIDEIGLLWCLRRVRPVIKEQLSNLWIEQGQATLDDQLVVLIEDPQDVSART